MVHAPHHVGHGQPLDGIERGHRCLQALAHSQRSARIAGPVHRLREDRVSIVSGLYDHVDRFSRAEAEFVHSNGLNVHPVDMHNLELQAGDAHVIEGVARAVDHAQTHPLASLEQRRPIAGRRDAVGKIGQGLRR